jgi:hypothetical protein
MHWTWLPCNGHSGGLLIGVDKEVATVLCEEQGEFFHSVNLSMIEDDFTWMLVNVYGPAHDDRKLDFLEEIQDKILATEIPIMLGGDFNLVRRIEVSV